jgi:hypothetical protein
MTQHTSDYYPGMEGTGKGQPVSIGRAFRAFFGDSEWFKKTGLGVLVMLIPYVGAIVFMGFEFRYLRDVAWGREERLPEWKDYKEHLKTGLFGFVVGMVYSLPLSLVLVIVVTAVSVVGVGAASYAQSIAALIWMSVGVFLVCAILVLAMSAILWPVYAQVALYDSIQAGFDFKGIWARTRNNASAFWKAFWKSVLLTAVSTGASLVVVAVLVALFGLWIAGMQPEDASLAVMLILPLELLAIALLSFVSFPVGLMNNHLWGQYARVAYELAAPAASEAVMAERYAEAPRTEYLPPPPL